MTPVDDDRARKRADCATPRGQRFGRLLATADTRFVIALDADAERRVIDLNRTALVRAGVSGDDSVVTWLASSGLSSAALLDAAILGVAGSLFVAEPRGRTRLLRTLQAIRPTTLVTTPCGAADLLSRLHIEFLVDPQEFGIERLLLVGEIAPQRTFAHLSREFDCEVHELCCDPVSGAVIASRSTSNAMSVEPTEPYLIDPLALESAVGESADDQLVEWSVVSPWVPNGTERHRTGLVGTHDGNQLFPPAHTIGDQLLIRGTWLSLDAIQQVLDRIDGVVAWTLEIDRSGTLDRASLWIGLSRNALVENPMWAGRIRDAIRSVSACQVDVVIGLHEGEPCLGTVRDRRGHHISSAPVPDAAEAAK